MAQYQTKPRTVEANQWTAHGSHPRDGIGEPLEPIALDEEGNPVLDENGDPINGLRTVGKIVAPYTVPRDVDNEPVNYQCTVCGTGMAGHGILQVGPNAGRIICPNSWLVESSPDVFELLRPRVFNQKYRAV